MQQTQFHAGLCLLAAVALAGPGLGQTQAPPTVNLSYEYDSGWSENTRAAAEVVISFPVILEDAQWMRLYFDEITLSGDLLAGNGAILRLTALADGAIQEMDARHLRQWQNSSAYFNGNTVLVEVLAQPGTGWNRVAMRSVNYGLIPTPEETICGPTDDRVLSNDPRSARILPIGCTGWLIDDCQQCFLTAGHCAGGTEVIQFNVPLSNSNGSINHPPPSDQYSVDPSSMQDNGGQGVGSDWAYFGAFANTNTGLTPGQAAGSTFELAFPPAVSGNNIRITGYGVDNSPSTWNQVQQTNVGPLVTSSGSLVQYAADTTGGNSGSPVIWENTGQAVGIHTHGGCTSGGGQNSGTGTSHTGLQSALASPTGICASGLNLPTTPPSLVPPGIPISLQVDLLATGSAVTLHYRLQAGAFIPVAMTPQGGGSYVGQVPAPSCGDTPEFYFSYQDPSCGLVTNPLAAPASFYSAAVGSALITFQDDFESDQGWTTSVVGASSGQWERGVPVNDSSWAYDPVSDSDGSGACFVTQNQNGNTDVDGGSVRLFSPALDLSAPSAFVSYDYYLYLTIEDGTDKLEVAARNNGSGPWTVIASHETSGELTWRSNVMSAADFTAAGFVVSNDVQLRFTANDTGTASITEAGLDAFTVGSVSCGPDVGTSYCSSGINGANLSASGSASVSSNDLLLVGSGLPTNTNGMFFYGDAQTNTPFGSGTLCVAGSNGIFRLQPVLNSGAAGEMSLAVDLTSPPDLLGQVTVGSTWNYQLWFRDGATSDLTQGLQVTFTP